MTTESKRLERFEILDVGIDPLTPAKATEEIGTLISEKRKGYVVFCTVSSLLSARDDPAVARAMQNAELVTPDGMPLVWLGRRRSAHPVERVYGPDLMLDFFAATGSQFSHYFYGGQPGVAEAAVERLCKRFPDLQVAGCSTPPMDVSGTTLDSDAIHEINASEADIVWVALGHPKQELWMSTNQEHLDAPVLAGVGAAFDFHAGRKKEAPEWMKKSGLQWLHRLASEPRRLWKRYLIGNLRFGILLASRALQLTREEATNSRLGSPATKRFRKTEQKRVPSSQPHPRVVHVGKYDSDSSNGVHKTIAGLTRGLPEHGVQVCVWNFTRRVKRPVRSSVDDIEIVELPRRRRLLGFLFGLPRSARRFVREHEVTIQMIHFHSVFVPENVHLARYIRVPYAVTPNGGYADSVMAGRNQHLKRFWMKLGELRYLKRAALVHAVSRNEHEALLETFRLDSVQYSPNGVDVPEGEVRLETNKPARIVFLGRLAVDHKGLDYLLWGYGRFVQQKGQRSSSLIIAGPDFRGGRELLQQISVKLGIEEDVIFPGALGGEAKWDLLRTADVFVHTSRWEGLPFAVLEALSQGVPVVVTPETNVAAEVHSYGAGVVVSNDPESIASGFATCLDDHERMAKSARVLAEEVFGWDSICRTMAEYYRQSVSKRTRLLKDQSE